MADYGYSMFASRVCQQWQFRRSHSFPKPGESAIITVDVLAVGKAFHHHRTGLEAALKFLNGIVPGWVNRNSRQELRMLTCQLEHVVIRHIEGTGLLHGASLLIINQILGENDCGSQR